VDELRHQVAKRVGEGPVEGKQAHVERVQSQTVADGGV
jgi:hypothetical protein